MQGEERSQPRLTPAQRELEDALRGLAPVAAAIDRDRLLFEAGAAAGRTRTRRMQWAIGALAAGLAIALLLRPEPTVIERVAYQPSTMPVVKLAEPDRKNDVPPGPLPGALASATRLPFPVPGGPFVAMPPRFVTMAGFQPASDTRTSAYLGAIQDVLEKGLDALPRTRTGRRGSEPDYGTQGVPPGDAPPIPATTESHPE